LNSVQTCKYSVIIQGFTPFLIYTLEDLKWDKNLL